MTKTFAKIFLSFFHHCVKIKLNFPKLQSYFDFSGVFNHVAKRKSVLSKCHKMEETQSKVRFQIRICSRTHLGNTRLSLFPCFIFHDAILTKNIYKLHSE
jgi:hypothetical protein